MSGVARSTDSVRTSLITSACLILSSFERNTSGLDGKPHVPVFRSERDLERSILSLQMFTANTWTIKFSVFECTCS